MRRTRLLLAVLALGPAACHPRHARRDEADPYPPSDLKVVAVLPFTAGPGIRDADTGGFADIFASEWVRVAGVRVVRPRGAEAPSAGLEDALRLAREAKADAFVTASVTDYDPYEPPRIGISVQFFRVEARPVSDSEVDRLVQSASWRTGPLRVGREGAGHWITAFERVYDARDRRVRDRLMDYSCAQGGRDTAFDRGREFLAVQPKYMQFVSDQVIREILRTSRNDDP